MNTITRLICTECGTGNLRKTHVVEDCAYCDQCGQAVSIAQDVAPYADDATLDMDADGYLVAVTA